MSKRLIENPIDPKKVNRPDLMVKLKKQAEKSSKDDLSKPEISAREAVRKAFRGSQRRKRDPGMPIVFRTATVRR